MVKKKKSRSDDTVGFGRWLRLLRELNLKLTQPKLAKKLGVQRSTVSAWENGEYRPSAAKLIQLGNLLDYPLCNEPWREGGVKIEKMESVSLSAKGPVAMIDIRSASHRNVDPCMWLFSDPSSAICVRVDSPIDLAPFDNGDVAMVHKSQAGDPWPLLSRLVAMHLKCLPKQLVFESGGYPPAGIPASQYPVNVANLVEVEAMNRRRHGIAQRRGADEEGAKPPVVEGMIELEAIQLGWLRLELANNPEFLVAGYSQEVFGTQNVGPWRLVLQGAAVKGVRGQGLGSIPLTEWDTSAVGNKPQLGLLGGNAILLGEVISWMRTGRAGVENTPPEADTEESRRTTSKQRKEEKTGRRK